MIPTSFNNSRFWQLWIHISGGNTARAELQLLPQALQNATVPTTPYCLPNTEGSASPLSSAIALLFFLCRDENATFLMSMSLIYVETEESQAKRPADFPSKRHLTSPWKHLSSRAPAYGISQVPRRLERLTEVTSLCTGPSGEL